MTRDELIAYEQGKLRGHLASLIVRVLAHEGLDADELAATAGISEKDAYNVLYGGPELTVGQYADVAARLGYRLTAALDPIEDPTPAVSVFYDPSDPVRAAAFSTAKACAHPEDIYKQLDAIVDAVRAAITVQERGCRVCGYPIALDTSSPTGWTHFGGGWEGKRCPGQITGAQPRDQAAHGPAAIAGLQAQLAAERERAERDLDNVMKERDAATDMCDSLAALLAPDAVLGEHSSMNDPYVNAIEYASSRWYGVLPNPNDAIEVGRISLATRVSNHPDPVPAAHVARVIAALTGTEVTG